MGLRRVQRSINARLALTLQSLDGLVLQFFDVSA
jgi:hypothetical protein